MKVKVLVGVLRMETVRWHIHPTFACDWFEAERTCWDPKDGELCQSRVKPGETLVEARSDTDVQIVRLILV